MDDLKRSTKPVMDKTPAPVLAPGRKDTKTVYFRALARDGQLWGYTDASDVALNYDFGRGGECGETYLEGFGGTLQVDGYVGYSRLIKCTMADIQLAYCRAHARRKLHDVTKSGAAPTAQDDRAKIQALCGIDKDLRGQTPDQRHAARQERSKPIINIFQSRSPKAAPASRQSPRTERPSRHIPKYWDGLSLFLGDGQIELDSNAVERTIRPVANGWSANVLNDI